MKSPVRLKGIYGDTNNAMRRYGGGDAIRTETAVMRALRWLKHQQDPDGSWGKNRIAMTALAVLTFLTHGERLGDSMEFDPTVQKALEYLLSRQKQDGRFEGEDDNGYSHPIATYALCEAYDMTLNPNLKAAAEKALVPIIKGQNPTGGWTYNMDPTPGEDGSYRNDTSYMGWCAQALKTAKLANLNVEGLDKALKLAVRGFKSNEDPDGGFGYTGSGTDGVTAVGAYCLMILGAADSREAKLALDLMKPWLPSLGDTLPGINGRNDNPQYYCYYASRCKYHARYNKGEWRTWASEMATLYVNEQKVIKNAIKDTHGRNCDIGWWENKDTSSDRPVMDTCLAAQQLMVFYSYRRQLPSPAIIEERADISTITDTEDIKIHADL